MLSEIQHLRMLKIINVKFLTSFQEKRIGKIILFLIFRQSVQVQIQKP